MKSAVQAIVAMLSVLSVTEAAAHVVLDKAEATVGSAYKAVLAIPHGCAGSPTTRLTVRIPEGMIAVKPIPKPGWTVETVKGPYQRSFNFLHGTKASEGVKEVTWTGRLADDHYDEFAFAGFVADSLKGGDTLAFAAIQQCEKGETSWTEVAAPGQDPHALKAPAPILRLVAAEGTASGAAAGNIVIAEPWSRATPKGAKVAAGYMTIQNKGTEPDRLVAASSDIAGKVEIHEMAVTNGVMTMRALDKGLAIDPGKTVALAPAGYHLMLQDLKQPLVQGASFGVTLEFERAGKIELKVGVRGIGGQAPADKSHGHGAGHDHSKM